MPKKKSHQVSIWYGIPEIGFFMGTAIALSIVIIVSLPQTLKDTFLLPGTVSTNGTIISCEMIYIPRSDPSCDATIIFETSSGVYITFSEAVGNLSEGYTVKVNYYPDNPYDAYIDTLPNNLTVDGICLGSLFVDFYAFKYWKKRKAKAYARKHKGLNPSPKPKAIQKH